MRGLKMNKKYFIRNLLLFLFLVSISAFRLNYYIALPAFLLILIYSFIIDGKIAVTGILKWGIVFWGYYLLSILWCHDVSDVLRYASAIVYIIGIFLFFAEVNQR